MPIVSRATAAASLLLLAACGGDGAADAPEAATSPAADTTALTVAEAPAAALDSAERAAARGDTAAVAATAPPAAAAPAPDAPALQGPVNAEAVAGYRLSMERIRQLVRAGEQLAELQDRRPELRDSMAVTSPDPNAIYERLNAVAPAREAIARAGMTPRDYALATTALLQAAMANEMRKQGMAPPGAVNEANVRFVDENWNEIQQMMQQVAQSRQRP